MPLWDLLFLPIGACVGVYGTLIGAGGGFLLVPLFIYLSPSDPPSLITAASLTIVLANAASGTIAYARMGRISYRTGWIFSAATIPGAVAGSYFSAFIPKRVFNWVFGILLLAVAVYVAVTRARRARAAGPGSRGGAAGRRGGLGSLRVTDSVRERDGTVHVVGFNLWLGLGLSLLIGAFSSLVGIGGGLIHVPLLSSLFGFPLHVATATSHFVLVFTALAGVLEHVITGTYPAGLPRILLLAAGVVGGAQAGARLSRKISGPWIAVGLAIALGLVGVRLLLAAL
jgi:uncharacterized protein